MNDKDVWFLYGKWHCSEELSDIIKEMKPGDKFYINMPKGNRKSVLKWITTSMVEHKLNEWKQQNIPLAEEEEKIRIELTGNRIKAIIETLPPDVQTIVHNFKRLDAEKEWYKWRLEYARELLEKGEVMKAKELLNQTDVDFNSFSELWEKAHAEEN